MYMYGTSSKGKLRSDEELSLDIATAVHVCTSSTSYSCSTK